MYEKSYTDFNILLCLIYEYLPIIFGQIVITIMMKTCYFVYLIITFKILMNFYRIFIRVVKIVEIV